MNNRKELHLDDIFHTTWDHLSWRKQTRTLRMIQLLRHVQKPTFYRGYLIKTVLKRLCKSKKIFRQLSPEQLVDCFRDHTLINTPCLEFTIKRIKTLRLKTYYAPHAKILDFTYHRFKVTDAKFTLYLSLAYEAKEKQTSALKSQIKSELGKFIACLYATKSGWNEDQLEKNGKSLLRILATWEQELIIETYGHIRNHIFSRFPELLPGTKEEEEEATEVTPFYTGKVWHDMHFDLAETEAFKGFENAGSANVYNVLTYLNRLVIRNRPKNS